MVLAPQFRSDRVAETKGRGGCVRDEGQREGLEKQEVRKRSRGKNSKALEEPSRGFFAFVFNTFCGTS